MTIGVMFLFAAGPSSCPSGSEGPPIYFRQARVHRIMLSILAVVQGAGFGVEHLGVAGHTAVEMFLAAADAWEGGRGVSS